MAVYLVPSRNWEPNSAVALSSKLSPVPCCSFSGFRPTFCGRSQLWTCPCAGEIARAVLFAKPEKNKANRGFIRTWFFVPLNNKKKTQLASRIVFHSYNNIKLSSNINRLTRLLGKCRSGHFRSIVNLCAENGEAYETRWSLGRRTQVIVAPIWVNDNSLPHQHQHVRKKKHKQHSLSIQSTSVKRTKFSL